MLYGTYWWSEELHHIHFPIQANFFDRAEALRSDKVNFHPSILGQDKIEITGRREISCKYLNIHSKVKSMWPVSKKMKNSVPQMEILFDFHILVLLHVGVNSNLLCSCVLNKTDTFAVSFCKQNTSRGEITIFVKNCLKFNQIDANNHCKEQDSECSTVYRS